MALEPKSRGDRFSTWGLLWGGVVAIWICAIGAEFLVQSAWHTHPLETPSDTVILLTMDGVRMHEMFEGLDPDLAKSKGEQTLMPFFTKEMVPLGAFLGARDFGSRFELGHPIGISMPSYHSIFTGRFTWCFRNECGPVWGQTLLSRVIDTFGQGALAFFSTYGDLCPAFSVPNDVTQICLGRSNNVVENFSETFGYRLGDKDAAVFSVAYVHVKEANRKLIYVGLEETDIAGHLDQYDDYTRILREYDQYLQFLVAEIDRQIATGRRVTLIVTTDHARGSGENWGQHRWSIKGTGDLWLAAYGSGIRPVGFDVTGPNRSLYDVRATIEYLLGLDVARADVMSEILEIP
ncbi:hypothetical protein [Shimia abyssi]|uniref:Type I phosphodiesterase/nucleotide pyrophosphatase n=1 Tax=Shimia abyssi TaxID=1662395 RepID=A0A2P8F8T5_9RHOB|nr:hypothetical protein [Shimia abyssi]PSL18129.1 hypothetical protein CLV88_11253 [Shimia abyssi]